MTCGKKTKHTARIGCCALCSELFSGDTAFAKHRGSGPTCTAPVDAGLISKPSRTASGEVIWSLPAGDNPWSKP